MKELTRWMITARVNDMTYVVDDDGNLSLHHIPQVWLNKDTAERVAKGYSNAKVIKLEGR